MQLPEMFPWCFNSIEVHPEGTCVLSRFVSEEFESEVVVCDIDISWLHI